MTNETKYKVLLMAGLPSVKELDGKVVNYFLKRAVYHYPTQNHKGTVSVIAMPDLKRYP